jgi:hypothetical protein
VAFSLRAIAGTIHPALLEGGASRAPDDSVGRATSGNRNPMIRMSIGSEKLRPSFSGGRLSCIDPAIGRCGSLKWRGALVGAVFLFAPVLRTEAQEIPRPSITRQKVKQSLPTAGNLRVGPVLLRVDANFSAEYVDNVNLDQSKLDDVILTPSVGVTAIWPMTRQNTLRFRTSIGYSKYINNPALDRQNLLISPDSALSFDVYVGDFRFNFHDQFSFQQETVSQGSLGGLAQLPRFINTIGASVLWDMNDVIWTLGYDHYDFITVGDAANSQGAIAQNFGQLDHTTDQVATSASFKLSSVAIGGFEIVGATSNYPDAATANFSSLTLGPYLEYQLTPYTHLFVSGGYKAYSRDSGALGSTTTTTFGGAGGSQNGYYVNVSFIHTLNRYFRDRLDFGHNDEVDAYNGRARTDFVRYSGTWQVNRKLSLGFGLFYDNVDQISGNLFTNGLPEKFWRAGGSLSTGYRLTENLDVSLAYRYTKKDSNIPQFSYSQNSVTISLGYRF